MIGIRVDVNETVATGHIQRCMTIAKQLKKHGETVLFFLADSFGIDILTENNYEYVVLNTDWENPIGEIPILVKEILKREIRTILFDSYRFSKEYFMKLREKLSEGVRLAYIDDLFEEIYPVDILINYNAYYELFPYKETYGNHVKLFLGPSFAPLREEFSKKKMPDSLIREKSEVQLLKAGIIENTKGLKHILLSSGGGDRYQSMRSILTAYSERIKRDENPFWRQIIWHVVVGRFTEEKEKLFELAENSSNIQIYFDVKNMADLMDASDLAVSAAGTMLYELAARKCPTIFFITADNQKYESSYFAKEDRMIDAGDFRKNEGHCMDEIFRGVKRVLTNTVLCDKMKNKLALVTDGKGAEKIAEGIL